MTHDLAMSLVGKPAGTEIVAAVLCVPGLSFRLCQSPRGRFALSASYCRFAMPAKGAKAKAKALSEPSTLMEKIEASEPQHATCKR